MKDLVREVSSNDIIEQDVPIKRLWDDCAGLNAADKTSKPFKSPKIQSLLDEIINDNSSKEQSISQGSSQKRKLSQNKVKQLAGMNALPKPPPKIVAEVFSDEVRSSWTTEIAAEVFEEEEHPDESTLRAKGDIIGFSDTEDS